MKILINALSGIGDAVMFFPALALLKKHRPDAQIDMLAMFSQVRDIFSNSPLLNKIYHIDFLHQSKFKSLQEVMAIRSNKYDYSINVYPSNRWEYNVLQRILGAKRRLATKYLNYSRRELDFLNTDLAHEVKDRHNVMQNFDLIKFIAPESNEQELGPYAVLIKKEDEEWANNFIKKNKLNASMLIGFHAGSQTFKRHINKRWAAGKYTELAKKLALDYGAKTLLFGTEMDVNNKIHNNAAEVTLIPETKNITESIALMKHCSLFVTNDTALMHIAAALQIPTIAIFAYTNYKELYPWKNKHIIVRRELACSPCFFNSPRPVQCIYIEDEEFKCIKEIELDEVCKACRKLIEEVPGNIKT
ncbi:MAG TPA: glycosyltransferase family 9 protein [Ignavibacteria bacterium]|jgi:heptosyltransferase-2